MKLGRNGTDYEEALFTRNTLNVIAKHNPKEPLFLFHAFHIVHTPLQVPKEQEDRFASLEPRGRRLYAAMLNYMDQSLAKFVTAFQKKGMWDNTLMVLSSDNGGPIYGVTGALGSAEGAANNMPLRGGKLSDWEGRFTQSLSELSISNFAYYPRWNSCQRKRFLPSNNELILV